MSLPRKERRKACVHELRVWDEYWLKRLGGPDAGKQSKRFVFKLGVNLLIGPNGGGKSSLLQLIFDNVGVKKKERKGLSLVADAGMYQRFDFEKDNPRGMTEGVMMMEYAHLQMHMTATRHSHGETTAKLLEMLREHKQRRVRCFLWDEPEQALDPAGLELLHQQLLKGGMHQVIIATHSLPLILESKFHVVELRPGYRRELAMTIMDYAVQAAELL